MCDECLFNPYEQPCNQIAIKQEPIIYEFPHTPAVKPARMAKDIMWTVKFRNGNVKRFVFPVRTTIGGG